MGKKSRQKRAPEHREPSAASFIARRPSSAARQPQFKHRWLARLTAAVAVPIFLFGVIEAGLRICGYGYSTKFFVPAGDGKTITTNPKFTWQYYPRKTATSPIPLLFEKQKAPGARRIFILGESAAAGMPDPAFGFARMLDLMLREQYPSNRFEVLNAATRGIDSHIIRQIARECAELSPDLFIIYAGNNDLIGLHSPSPGDFAFSANVHWLRFKNALHRLKLMQFGEALLAGISKKEGPKQDMEFFRRQRLAFDDPRRESVCRNYEINLRDICTMADDAGAQAIVCSVGANLHDFPPLASLHRTPLNADDLSRWEKLYAEGTVAESARNFTVTLTHFENAARLDDHYAELHFHMARCYEASGNLDDARKQYALARDWDALQFRADSRMNGIVRSIAKSVPGIHFADIEQRCAESPLAENGVPGGKIFQEHVHFRFEGDYTVASALLSEVVSALKLPAAAKPPLSQNDCARKLAYTAVDEFNVRSAVARLTANPPFLDQLEHSLRQARMEGQLQAQAQGATTQLFEQATAIYEQATAARPDDWMLHYNFGNLLKQMGQHRHAAMEFSEVVKRLPNQPAFRIALANALLESGQTREAAEQFEAALKLNPGLQPAQQGLRAARGGR